MVRGPGFAFPRQFLAAAVEDGIPLKTALAKVIRARGVKEFAEQVGMPSPNVLRAIHPKHNPTHKRWSASSSRSGSELGSPSSNTDDGAAQRD